LNNDPAWVQKIIELMAVDAWIEEPIRDTENLS
jgi:translation elongation factor EF-Tu-like GTPase